jgi:hypothetical protein
VKSLPKNSVLWFAAAGFALLLVAWTAFFIVAAHNRVPEVPLASGQR